MSGAICVSPRSRTPIFVLWRLSRPTTLKYVYLFCFHTITFTLYNCQVESLRGDNLSLFVSLRRPHTSVTARTLGRWIKTLLSSSGVDTGVWDTHATRGAAARDLRDRGLTALQVMKLADWSTCSGTFQTFYERYI